MYKERIVNNKSGTEQTRLESPSYSNAVIVVVVVDNDDDDDYVVVVVVTLFRYTNVQISCCRLASCPVNKRKHKLTESERVRSPCMSRSR